ncbi:MAG: hypothetical protein ACRCSY_05585 [Cetobacterium sp.]
MKKFIVLLLSILSLVIFSEEIDNYNGATRFVMKSYDMLKVA